MNFTTIFFMDIFLEKQKDQKFFIENFFPLLDSLKKEKVSSFFLSRNQTIIENYFPINMVYTSNLKEQEQFLKNHSPKNTIIISDDSKFLDLCRTLGYACTGFSHENEYLPVTYCFEDLSSLTYHYLEYIYKRCQNLPMTIAETKSLLIREFNITDMPQLFALYQNKRNLRYMFQQEMDYAQFYDKYSAYIKHIYPFYDYGLWAVILKETGRVIGEFGLQHHSLDSREEITLEYILHPDFQGRGFASQTIRAIFRYARDVLAFNRIVAVIHPENIASICVAKKCGMHFEKEFLFQNQVFHLYVILVQEERFFSKKDSPHKSIKEQVYQQYQQHPDTSVYGKRYKHT